MTDPSRETLVVVYWLFSRLLVVSVFYTVFSLVLYLSQAWVDRAPDTPGFRWRRPRL